MYFTEDRNFAMSRNSDLVEELGQVEFVFSDKTGTLTQNKMKFSQLSLPSAKIYGDSDSEICTCDGICKESISDI